MYHAAAQNLSGQGFGFKYFDQSKLVQLTLMQAGDQNSLSMGVCCTGW